MSTNVRGRGWQDQNGAQADRTRRGRAQGESTTLAISRLATQDRSSTKTSSTYNGLFALNVEETVNPYTEWTRAVPDDALIGSTWMVTASCTVDVPTTVTGTLGIAVQNAIGHGEGVLIRQEATFDGSWQVAASWLLWALGPDDGPDAQAVWLGGDPFTSIELRIRSIKQ